MKLSPVQGILPSGWIEKHVHALPSTILFVTELDFHQSSKPSSDSSNKTQQQQQMYDQALLEQHLLTVVENITSTAAKKRDVPIHLVVLVRMEQEIHLKYGEQNNTFNIGDKMIILNERIQSIKSVLRLNSSAITMLPYFSPTTDVDEMNETKGDQNVNTKNVMKYNLKQLAKLQQVLYENSNSYYIAQVRRFKRKHALLHHDKIYDLLPFAIRYCIKIAIFYEFQCSSLDNVESLGGTTSTPFKEEEEEKIKREKSVKYWKEAYKNIIEYYHFLIKKETQLRTEEERIKGQRASILDESVTGKRIPQKMTVLDDTDDENDDDQLTPSKNQNSFGENERDGENLQNNDDDQTSLIQQPNSLTPPPPPSDSTPVHGSVEVALVYSPASGQGGVAIGAKTPLKSTDIGNDDIRMTSRTHSEDMIHQCRAVADWINLKLLFLLSNAVDVTNDITKVDGMVNLANQIRKHAQVFLSKPVTMTRNFQALSRSIGKTAPLNDPTWYFWQFVAHQKQVFAEFTDQFVKKPLEEVLNSLPHDVSCQFSTAKHFMTSGEALLKLGDAIEKDRNHVEKKKNDSVTVDSRQRFVGSLALFELQNIFYDEGNRNHADLALEAFKLASTEFEKEVESTSQVVLKKVNISYARLNQLIGGIYLKQRKFEDAIKHLELALSYSKTFPTISVILEKALIHCFKNLLTQELKFGNKEDQIKNFSTSTLNLVLTSGVSKILSNPAISDLFKDVFEVSSNGPNKHILIEWPGCKDAEQPFEYSFTFPDQTYAIEGDVVKATLQLRSNVSFPIKLLALTASSPLDTNLVKIELENEINCVLRTGETKEVSAMVTLQSNLSKVVDKKLVELQSVKGEKPKTAGLTSLGGGIYSDKKNRKKFTRGGLCIGCTVLNVRFSLPTYEEKMFVTIKLLNSHCGSNRPISNVKRAAIEEDNYIYSAWSRPTAFPLTFGPRCLRVVCPQPNLEITDVTTSLTNGRLMEGTVNRILLKLRAGPNEHCKNVKLSVICSSSLEEGLPNSSSLLDMEHSTEDAKDFSARQPILVEPCGNDHTSINLPSGWRMNNKNNGQGARDNWFSVQDTLYGGSSTYAYFDLFRKLPEYEGNRYGRCRTNFLVTVTYSQIRKTQCDASRHGDIVVQEYRGTAIWCSPMKAKVSFSPATRKMIPSGIRHKGNLVSTGISAIPTKDSVGLKSGSIAFMKCTIEAAELSKHIEVHLAAAKFEYTEEVPKQSALEVELIRPNNKEASNILYTPNQDSICKSLSNGMKVNIPFAVRPCISEGFKEESIIGQLGTISLDWSSVPLQIPGDCHLKLRSNDTHSGFHGPLTVKNLQSLKYHCPSCHVEKTPFEASFQTVPQIPQVGSPFEVRYQIVNRTKFHQRLRVVMNDSDSAFPSNNMLISGVINGEIVLGPLEEKLLSYSLLVTKVGQTTIPSLDVSSIRYNTWIIHGSTMKKIFVSP